MTLPVTLAETPALPRAAEAAVAGPAKGEEGEARFAETLAGAMGTATGPAAKAATGDTAATGAKPDEAAPPAEIPVDAEAMLADLEQQAAAVEGEAVTPGAAMDQVLAMTGAEAPVEDAAALTVPGDGADLSDGAAGEETTQDVAVTEEQEVPLELPLTALLAAALPAAPSGEAAAPTVQPTDASVEAARRAMAASMTMPGLAKADKDGKGPLEGPETAEAEAGFEAESDGKDEGASGKVAPGAELRPAAVAVAPVGTEQRTGMDQRREATEITLAGLGRETVEASAPTSTGSGTATAQVGAQALPGQPGGPIHLARPGWETALADRIAAELSGDGKEIELDLAPETLGHLKIKLEVVDGLAQVRIVTETTEAARLFQQSEHRLSESLSRAGLSLGGQDTTSRDSQSGQAQAQAGQGGSGPGDRGGRPRGLEMHFDRQGGVALAEQTGRAGRGLVNLIA